jgi:hypothetical protein
MPVIKYDVSDVEVGSGGAQPPAGLYKAKIIGITHRTEKRDGSEANDLEVILDVGADYANVFTYVGLSAPSAWKLREFLDAMGMNSKGAIDTDKLIGKQVQVKVNADQYQGEYRARVGTFMKLKPGQREEAPPPADDEDEEPSAATTATEEADTEYDEWEDEDLVAEVDERGIEIKGRKTRDKMIDALRDYDGPGAQEPEEEEEGATATTDDYEEWSIGDLKDELKDREITIKGRQTKDKMISALRSHDAAEGEADPFEK